MRRFLLTTFCLMVGLGIAVAEDPVFRLEPIDTEWHRPEGCCVIDVNGDGRLDVVSGPNWYEEPKEAVRDPDRHRRSVSRPAPR